MTRKERLNYRNEKVRAFFMSLEIKHPEWKLSALLEKTASEFPPISPATVSAILKEQGTYSKKVKI